MAMYIIANNLPGNCHTVHPAAGADLIDVPDRITDPVMVEIDPVLEMGSIAVICVMNSFQELSPQKNSEFARINLVILITIASDPFVATRLGDNELLHLLVEVTIQPAGHRSFFHGQDLFSLERINDRADRRYGCRY